MKFNRRMFLALASTSFLPSIPAHGQGDKKKWWETAVFYEIYPRSFQDGNGDGIGDFVGIQQRIDYLADLGIDALWIAACFDSPNADNGYDVRDYRKIAADFGSMDDFESFLGCAKKKKIRVILDMVFNHTSDEHVWFVESRKSLNNPYRDFYHWHDGKNGKPPTNWETMFGGSAWTLDAVTGQYYLHSFSSKQPDLNWENPQLRKKLFEILKFWIDKGVSGFRFDAITFIAKPEKLEDISDGATRSKYDFADHGERLHHYLREMHDEVFSGTDIYSVGEAWVNRKKIEEITDYHRGELSSAFRFDLTSVIANNPMHKNKELETIRLYNKDNAFTDNQSVWPIVYLEDHDFPRSVSRFGSALPEYHEKSAMLLATMMLSLRGTPYIYQGQEIGMENFPFQSIDQLDDVAAHQEWHSEVEQGKITPHDFFTKMTMTSRDNARTPMQWNNSPYEGFTKSSKPWMHVNPNFQKINVMEQKNRKGSILSFYKKLIYIRKKNTSLIYGNYRDISPQAGSVYSYLRDDNRNKFLIALNFSDHPQYFYTKEKLRELIISNYDMDKGELSHDFVMKPWQSAIFKV